MDRLVGWFLAALVRTFLALGRTRTSSVLLSGFVGQQPVVDVHDPLGPLGHLGLGEALARDLQDALARSERVEALLVELTEELKKSKKSWFG